MKQKIIATALVFILLSAGCRIGDPILGKWNETRERSELEELGRIGTGATNQPDMEFLSDGTYKSYLFFFGKWKRLDDSRLEIKIDPTLSTKGSTRIVTVKIEGNILTITESDGKGTRFKRQD